MPNIPLQKNRREKAQKAMRELTGTTKDIERLLRKARVSYVEKKGGNPNGGDDGRILLDLAIERGLDHKAITDGPNVIAQIDDMLGTAPSLSHAAGLLLNAADHLVAVGRVADADTIKAIAASIGGTAVEVQSFRNYSIPTRPADIRIR